MKDVEQLDTDSSDSESSRYDDVYIDDVSDDDSESSFMQTRVIDDDSEAKSDYQHMRAIDDDSDTVTTDDEYDTSDDESDAFDVQDSDPSDEIQAFVVDLGLDKSLVDVQETIEALFMTGVFVVCYDILLKRADDKNGGAQQKRKAKSGPSTTSKKARTPTPASRTTRTATLARAVGLVINREDSTEDVPTDELNPPDRSEQARNRAPNDDQARSGPSLLEVMTKPATQTVTSAEFAEHLGILRDEILKRAPNFLQKSLNFAKDAKWELAAVGIGFAVVAAPMLITGVLATGSILTKFPKYAAIIYDIFKVWVKLSSGQPPDMEDLISLAVHQTEVETVTNIIRSDIVTNALKSAKRLVVRELPSVVMTCSEGQSSFGLSECRTVDDDFIQDAFLPENAQERVDHCAIAEHANDVVCAKGPQQPMTEAVTTTISESMKQWKGFQLASSILGWGTVTVGSLMAGLKLYNRLGFVKSALLRDLRSRTHDSASDDLAALDEMIEICMMLPPEKEYDDNHPDRSTRDASSLVRSVNAAIAKLKSWCNAAWKITNGDLMPAIVGCLATCIEKDTQKELLRKIALFQHLSGMQLGISRNDADCDAKLALIVTNLATTFENTGGSLADRAAINMNGNGIVHDALCKTGAAKWMARIASGIAIAAVVFALRKPALDSMQTIIKSDRVKGWVDGENPGKYRQDRLQELEKIGIKPEHASKYLYPRTFIHRIMMSLEYVLTTKQMQNLYNWLLRDDVWGLQHTHGLRAVRRMMGRYMATGGPLHTWLDGLIEGFQLYAPLAFVFATLDQKIAIARRGSSGAAFCWRFLRRIYAAVVAVAYGLIPKWTDGFVARFCGTPDAAKSECIKKEIESLVKAIGKDPELTKQLLAAMQDASEPENPPKTPALRERNVVARRISREFPDEDPSEVREMAADLYFVPGAPNDEARNLVRERVRAKRNIVRKKSTPQNQPKRRSTRVKNPNKAKK